MKSDIVGINALECSICNHRLESVDKLKNHVLQYSGAHMYCKKCNSYFEDCDHKCDATLNVSIQCEDCGKHFKQQHGLKIHSRLVHGDKTQLKCEICDEILLGEDEFNEHSAMHDPNDKVMCTGCNALFNTMKEYKAHAKLYPNAHNFICNLCERNFTTERQYERHVCIWENNEPLKCACGIIFRKYSEFLQHSKGGRPYRCCSCAYKSNNLFPLIQHIRSHLRPPLHKCRICKEFFLSRESLNNHKKIHLKISDLQEEHPQVQKDDNCLPCTDPDNSLESTYFHGYKRKTNMSESLCPGCGKMFDSSHKLTQHMLSAHSTKNVTCDICKKTLKTKKILIEHLKTHMTSESGSRVPQAICPYCGLGLSQKGSLARHISLIHERDKLIEVNKPKVCKICSQLLPNQAKYYSHLRQHRAMVERFPCTICSRQFNKRQNMLRHMKLLHNPNRIVQIPSFSCDLCNRAFREKKNLQRHERLYHNLYKIIL